MELIVRWISLGFEPWTSGARNDRSTNWATTTAPIGRLFVENLKKWGQFRNSYSNQIAPAVDVLWLSNLDCLVSFLRRAFTIFWLVSKLDWLTVFYHLTAPFLPFYRFTIFIFTFGIAFMLFFIITWSFFSFDLSCFSVFMFCFVNFLFVFYIPF